MLLKIDINLYIQTGLESHVSHILNRYIYICLCTLELVFGKEKHDKPPYMRVDSAQLASHQTNKLKKKQDHEILQKKRK